MSLFPTQAINELAQEFKLLRKDIQAIKEALLRIEKSLSSTSSQIKNYEK